MLNHSVDQKDFFGNQPTTKTRELQNPGWDTYLRCVDNCPKPNCNDKSGHLQCIAVQCSASVPKFDCSSIRFFCPTRAKERSWRYRWDFLELRFLVESVAQIFEIGALTSSALDRGRLLPLAPKNWRQISLMNRLELILSRSRLCPKTWKRRRQSLAPIFHFFSFKADQSFQKSFFNDSPGFF